MDYTALLSAALADLAKAVDKLTAKTFPATSLPRKRKFDIVPNKKVIWPHPHSLKRISSVNNNYFFISDNTERNITATYIIAACQNQPRLILRALRRIQAATAWCYARAEGRQREAEEITRQQAKAIEALEAETAMLALK